MEIYNKLKIDVYDLSSDYMVSDNSSFLIQQLDVTTDSLSFICNFKDNLQNYEVYDYDSDGDYTVNAIVDVRLIVSYDILSDMTTYKLLDSKVVYIDNENLIEHVKDNIDDYYMQSGHNCELEVSLISTDEYKII